MSQKVKVSEATGIASSNKLIKPRRGSDLAVYGEELTTVYATGADGYGQKGQLAPDDWSNHPRTLTLGLGLVVWLLTAASSEQTQHLDFTANLIRGVKYAQVFFLLYCILQLRDGHFVRPHPAVWRFVTGCFILYEMFLIVLLFQNTQDARNLFKFYDEKLGVELPSQSYGEDCRVFTPEDPISLFRNIYDTILDRFVVMHFLGWIVGALMMRSYIVCWTVSILFEFYELTFAHWLPNFRECWWDHLFLDILICNALGIYFGMRICHWFEMKNYDWVGLSKIPNFTGKAQRAMAQFLPVEWLPYDWEMFTSFGRFYKVMFMIVALSVMILNSFFLKTVLWIPASSELNVLRLLIWYSAGSYAVSEYYIFCIYYTSVKKLGPRAWLGIGVVITEICIILKHGKGMFTEPFPPLVKYGWYAFFSVLILGSNIYFAIIKYKKKQN